MNNRLGFLAGRPYLWYVLVAAFYLLIVGGGFLLARLIIGMVRQ